MREAFLFMSMVGNGMNRTEVMYKEGITPWLCHGIPKYHKMRITVRSLFFVQCTNCKWNRYPLCSSCLNPSLVYSSSGRLFDIQYFDVPSSIWAESLSSLHTLQCHPSPKMQSKSDRELITKWDFLVLLFMILVPQTNFFVLEVRSSRLSRLFFEHGDFT